MATAPAKIPDGLGEIAHAMPMIMDLVASTARWVHPDVFHSLPVWRPDTARRLYQADWLTPQLNSGSPKFEGNVAAQTALMSALGVSGRKLKNWTTCHIWGYDDDRFASTGSVVRDRRFFSCVGNMVLLPTPLKGFTDAVPEIKRHLRVCAYHLYGWACEHDSVAVEAVWVRSGEIPTGYPGIWPTADRKVLPPGTGPANAAIAKKVFARKRQISVLLSDLSFPAYPRDEVRRVIEFWKIALPSL